jgi:DNA-binding MarR family transcriptional regulator
MNHAQRLARAQTENFGHVLLACARRLDELAQARVNARRAGPPLARPSVMRLVPFLDDETGVRPAELARRLDVSKQAVNQALAPLLDAGLVTLEPDPSDGRALLAKLTPAGAASFQLGLDTLASFEAPLAARMTSPSFETTFRGLRRILALLQDTAPEPPPPPASRKPAPPRRSRPS